MYTFGEWQQGVLPFTAAALLSADGSGWTGRDA